MKIHNIANVIILGSKSGLQNIRLSKIVCWNNRKKQSDFPRLLLENFKPVAGIILLDYDTNRTPKLAQQATRVWFIKMICLIFKLDYFYLFII